MAINPEHIPLYQEAFSYLRANLREHEQVHAMIIGYQEILPEARKVYPFETVRGLFESWAWETSEIDHHDSRAQFRHDLNQPFEYAESVLPAWHLVFDIGTLEHIADSQMALENYLSALRVGGYLFLLTPCEGYYDHGLHTFSPEYILETLKQNGCEIEWVRYAMPEWKGGSYEDSIDKLQMDDNDVLIVLIARLTREFHRPIKSIQQARWKK